VFVTGRAAVQFPCTKFVVQACELLGIGWEMAHEMMSRAVERGLERRQLEAMKHFGMDEKSFGRG
jgi:transposase